MLMDASSSNSKQVGHLCEDFILLYNSKIHGGLKIKIHQLFENGGHREAIFFEGVLTIILAGILCRIHKAVLGAFSPFSFSKMQPLSTNKEKD
jgi:hypothetical protein